MSGLARPVALVLGVVLLLIGVAGFFVSGTLLVFEVSPIHNVVHIASGLIGIWAAMSGKSKVFLIVFGVVYAAVAALGFMMDGEIFGLFHANGADNWLHTAIAVVCLAVGATAEG